MLSNGKLEFFLDLIGGKRNCAYSDHYGDMSDTMPGCHCLIPYFRSTAVCI
jgi:hypothetical protein